MKCHNVNEQQINPPKMNLRSPLSEAFFFKRLRSEYFRKFAASYRSGGSKSGPRGDPVNVLGYWNRAPTPIISRLPWRVSAFMFTWEGCRNPAHHQPIAVEGVGLHVHLGRLSESTLRPSSADCRGGCRPSPLNPRRQTLNPRRQTLVHVHLGRLSESPPFFREMISSNVEGVGLHVHLGRLSESTLRPSSADDCGGCRPSCSPGKVVGILSSEMISSKKTRHHLVHAPITTSMYSFPTSQQRLYHCIDLRDTSRSVTKRPCPQNFLEPLKRAAAPLIRRFPPSYTVPAARCLTASAGPPTSACGR